MKKLIIEKELLINNINKIKAFTSSTIIAVLKNNGYGLGLDEYPKILLENGIDFFAVATAEEALTLRNNGFNNKIMLLHSNSVKDELKKLIDTNIILTIGSFNSLNALVEVIGDSKIDIQLKLDTGFGRFGFLYSELPELIKKLKEYSNINIIGTFSHFSMAFNPKPEYTKFQFENFNKSIELLKSENINVGQVHIANSSAFLKNKETHLDCVRVGSAFLGRILVPNELRLNKIVYMESEIEDIKILPSNHFIGYSNTFKTKKETKIGVIPVGYLDGFMVSKKNDCFRTKDILREMFNTFKTLNKKTFVKIDDTSVPILGKIGTNNITVDLTNVDNIGSVKLDINPMYVNPNIKREFKK